MEFYKMHQYRIILQYIKNESFNSNSALRSSNKKKKRQEKKNMFDSRVAFTGTKRHTTYVYTCKRVVTPCNRVF